MPDGIDLPHLAGRALPPVSHPHDSPPAAPRARAAQTRFWDRFARRYAALAIADPAGYEATLARVSGLLQRQHAVLEIGCGTGTTALRLAHRVRTMRAVDASSEMIAIAREKQSALPEPLPSLQFEVADAEAPAAAGTHHDVILAFNVLHLLSDLDTALDTLVAQLAPGGLLISKTPCVGEMHPLVPRLLLPLLRWLGKAPAMQALTGPQLQATLQRHGLVLDAVERHGSKRQDIRVFIVARKPA